MSKLRFVSFVFSSLLIAGAGVDSASISPDVTLASDALIVLML